MGSLRKSPSIRKENNYKQHLLNVFSFFRIRQPLHRPALHEKVSEGRRIIHVGEKIKRSLNQKHLHIFYTKTSLSIY
jgi:hypothetical protein